MEYNLFYKKERLINIISIFVIFLWIIGLILFILNFVILFKVVVIIDLMLLMIEHLDLMKYVGKKTIDKPIIISRNNIYLLQDKSSTFIMIISVVLFVMILFFRVNTDVLYYLLIMIYVFLIEGTDLLKRLNIKKLVKNIDNYNNIEDLKGKTYKIIETKSISKSGDDEYTITISNNVEMNIMLNEKYNKYDELINSLDSFCSQIK